MEGREGIPSRTVPAAVNSDRSAKKKNCMKAKYRFSFVGVRALDPRKGGTASWRERGPCECESKTKEERESQKRMRQQICLKVSTDALGVSLRNRPRRQTGIQAEGCQNSSKKG